MNHILPVILLGLAALATSTRAADLQTPNARPVNRVLMREGRMYEARGNQLSPMKDDVRLPHDIRVSTNGTYTVNNGTPRKFAEGQALGADGMLTSPNGSIVPVYDHVVMRAGKPGLFKDGTSRPVTTPLTLKDGTRIQPDGFIVTTDGRRLRLLDGQFFRLDGKPIPTRDSITLAQGKVTVHKDGSRLTVPPGRSLVMNDGTKVFGNGTVLMKDGSRRRLAEGEILTVEGVVTRR
ncbi:MAG: hypothetical protein JXQ71_00040 [Verrucomicrobia bacterium]|nr:hypothetical protein [Verrucomicrobiota bacterium]